MAAQNATLVMVGLSSKRTYLVDVYAPDAAGTLLTFNPTGAAAATSPSTFRVPEDVVIRDISVAASPTATNFTLNVNGSVIAGGVVRWANQLNTLPFRTPVNIPIKAGDFIGGTQAA
jgi:hypothetical protein